MLVIRRRQLGSVWHEQIEFRNTSASAISAVVELEVAADFADVFAIKAGRAEQEGEHSLEVNEHGLLFGWRLGDVHRQAELTVDGPAVQVSPRGFVWKVIVDRHAGVSCAARPHCRPRHAWVERKHHHPNLPNAERRNAGWLASVPKLRTADRTLSAAYDRSIEDIGALAPARPHRPASPGDRRGCAVVHDPVRARRADQRVHGVADRSDVGDRRARGLAELQGREVDPVSEEEPGRIMHETRYLGVDAPTLTGGSTYYGSADATPLFVVLLGELCRWGLGDDDLLKLLPHADRALEWMEKYGDRDGDGYIEYQTTSERGLAESRMEGLRRRHPLPRRPGR